jgi:hypothetical protein
MPFKICVINPAWSNRIHSVITLGVASVEVKKVMYVGTLVVAMVPVATI